MTSELHPAFAEAIRIRQGVRRLGVDGGLAMITVTEDWDGEIAANLTRLYRDERNPVEAIVTAFLAGMLLERDRVSS